MTVAEKVRPLAQKAAEAGGAELWDVEFLREGPQWVLRVTIDSPGGVDTDMCERVSRALDPMLDKADPIPQSYTLEVSSAGVERVLRDGRDYQRYLGEYAEVKLFNAVGGAKEHLGHLTAFDDETLTLDEKVFLRADIAHVRLRIKF
ncbi:MAG: ribosome maturation factor RimP [Oscillospiraceae bacterium]|jgi:ribosome maturation factor RimP|nr:ribosome maturation factor RimP [Oscillospiraceae bacterium]